MARKIFVTIALLVALTAGAQQFSRKAMIGSARQSLESKFGKTYNNLSIVEDLGQMAVVSSANGGTAYIDKTTNKVLGIAPLPYAKGDTVPCGLQLWMGAANNAIKKGITQQKTYQSSSAADISPFITTKWNQNKPYYNLCPKSGSDICATGCVATAMAQVMNYFEYPSSGHGTSTYSVTSGSGSNAKTTTYTGTIDGTYDWGNMLDSYVKSYTNAQATAVATLMRDCGYSVHMRYTKESSGAASFYVPSAMAYNFDYDSLSVNYLEHDYCTDEYWYNVIYSELEAKRPILFGGQSASGNGGHEFVLDGMMADGKVHINWGWGGIGNGYFDLSVMSSKNDYILNQEIVYGFNPQPTPENSTKTYNSNIIVEDPQISTANGHLYFNGAITNHDWRNFIGEIAMCVEDVNDADNTYNLGFLDSDVAFPGGYGWSFYDDPLDFNSYFIDKKTNKELVFPASTYEISVVYKGKYDDEEKTAMTEGGVEWKKQFTVAADGTITIDESTGISSVAIDKSSNTTDTKVYNLNGNRVTNSYKGLKIVKGKKYVEK